MMMQATVLDCKGLKSPLSMVKISRAIKKMEAGHHLIVEATDSVFKIILEAWTDKMNHRLLAFEGGQIQRAVIQKLA